MGEWDTRVKVNDTWLEHTYITGFRDENNTFVNSTIDIPLKIHIRGKEYATFANILNIMFQMEKPIPTPEPSNGQKWYVASRFHSTLMSRFTDPIPICRDEKIYQSGCWVYRFRLHSPDPEEYEYKARVYAQKRVINYFRVMVDNIYPSEFYAQELVDPVLEFLLPRPPDIGPWKHINFPELQWREMKKPCCAWNLRPGGKPEKTDQDKC